MTIGIGVLCEDGDCMLLASDLRVHRGTTQHDYAGKQWDLLPPFTGAAAVAGKLSLCHDIVSELTERLNQLEAEPDIRVEHVENAVNDARLHILRRRTNWQLRSELGISLSQLHTGKTKSGRLLSAETVRRGCEIVKNTPLEAQLIIAGYFGKPDDRRAAWMKIDRKQDIQSTTTPGFFVIGSGATYAYDHLDWRRQNVDSRLPSSLLHMYEALKQATRDRYVGLPMAYVVIKRDGTVMRIEANHPTLRNWAKHYKRRNDTISLDNSTIARQQVQWMFREHTVRR